MRTWARNYNGMMSYGYMNSVTEGRLCPPDQCSKLQFPEPAGTSVLKCRDWMLCSPQVCYELFAQGLNKAEAVCVLANQKWSGHEPGQFLTFIHTVSIQLQTQSSLHSSRQCITMVCTWLTHSQHWSGLERTQLWEHLNLSYIIPTTKTWLTKP